MASGRFSGGCEEVESGMMKEKEEKKKRKSGEGGNDIIALKLGITMGRVQ